MDATQLLIIAMAQTYKQLQAKITQLQKQAHTARSSEVVGIVKRIKDAIAAYDLTAADIFGTGNRFRLPSKRSPAIASAKYLDGRGGTWGGRGKRPDWLRNALANGASLESFRARDTQSATAKTIAKKGTTKRVAQAYSDGTNSWAGFGPRPAWLKEALLAGRSLESLQA